MRGSISSTVGAGNVVKPPLALQLEDAKTQGFSSYSNTYPFNYLFGDKELLARQVGVFRRGVGDLGELRGELNMPLWRLGMNPTKGF